MENQLSLQPRWDSMIRYPRPTRAEASDVANAIYDGTSVLCCLVNSSWEISAVSMDTMARIAKKAEKAIDY